MLIILAVIFSIVFSAISYWLSNFQPTVQAFFTWVLWLFLDLLAAEGLVVLLTSIFPSFVVSLALVAFANGLWMSVDGFMVPPTILNVFYRYVFHFWDYQKYVFENMMVNEFSERVYSCATVEGGCQCESIGLSLFDPEINTDSRLCCRHVADGPRRPVPHPRAGRARPVRLQAGVHGQGRRHHDGHHRRLPHRGVDRAHAEAVGGR